MREAVLIHPGEMFQRLGNGRRIAWMERVDRNTVRLFLRRDQKRATMLLHPRELDWIRVKKDLA